MRFVMESDHRLFAGGPLQDGADTPDFFDGADRARSLRPPRRDEVSPDVACPMVADVPDVDPICPEPTWQPVDCSGGYASLANPYGVWTTDMSPPPPKQTPVRIAPPSSMAGMVAAIHNVLHARIDPMERIEHRDLWQTYARTLIAREDPLGQVVGRAVLGDPIKTWFRGIDGAQTLGGLMRLGSWMDAKWDRGLQIELDGRKPGWTALERVSTEFAFLRLVVHDLQPRLLNIVGETPRMQAMRFTSQNLDGFDLGWLDRFGSLTALDVEGFTLRHLDPVQAHHRLEQLRVASCRGPLELSVLTSNSALIDLSVTNCPITDGWASLPGFAEMRRLTLGGQAEWTTIDALRDCTQVTDLRLTDLELVADLGPVCSLTGIEQLRIDNLAVSDIEPLVELPQLRELTLSRGHQLTEFAALGECIAVTDLTLHRLMWLRDLSPVTRIPALTRLTVSKCRRWLELPTFPPDSKLEELTLVGCPAIEELHGLAMCGRLRVVRLLQTSVVSIRDFVGLPSLEAVVLLDPERDTALRDAFRRAGATERPAAALAPDHPKAKAFVLPANPEDV